LAVKSTAQEVPQVRTQNNNLLLKVPVDKDITFAHGEKTTTIRELVQSSANTAANISTLAATQAIDRSTAANATAALEKTVGASLDVAVATADASISALNASMGIVGKTLFGSARALRAADGDDDGVGDAESNATVGLLDIAADGNELLKASWLWLYSVCVSGSRECGGGRVIGAYQTAPLLIICQCRPTIYPLLSPSAPPRAATPALRGGNAGQQRCQ
jgi:hypothetical protein